MKNTLRHLVSDEVGVSAVLATALDPEVRAGTEAMRETLNAGLAKLLGLELSVGGPSAVHVEYPRNGDATTDILLVWDDWAIFIENKIKKASIRKGQLERSYTQFKIYMRNHPELKDATRIAMVFLTPGGVGGKQLEDLELEAAHHKAMLNWDDVHPLLKRAFAGGSTNDDAGDGAGNDAEFALAFMRRAVERTGEVLARETGAPKIAAARNDTPNRVRCKEFMRRLEKRLGGGEPSLRSKGQWNNEEGDILFGDMGVKPTANWYITPLARDGGSTVDEDGTCDLRMKLEFKVATQTPMAVRKRATAELEPLMGREKELAAEIGIPEADLSIKPSRREVTMYYHRAGNADDLIPELERHVRSLVARFRSYFEVAGGDHV